jgi:hypothetical protein
VPEELATPPRRFSVAAVVEHANVLRAVVAQVLPMLEFESDGGDWRGRGEGWGDAGGVGMVHYFKEGSFGVDIEAFELPVLPPWLM